MFLHDSHVNEEARFWMKGSKYMRLGTKPKKAFMEGNGRPYLFPFPQIFCFSIGWGKRNSSIQLSLTERFPIFNFAQSFWNFLFSYCTHHPIPVAQVYIFCLGWVWLTTWLRSGRISIFPVGASVARSPTFLALGCACLTHPEHGPIRHAPLRCATGKAHRFTSGSLKWFVFAAHGGEC